MSDASAKGLYLERQVASLIRKKLGARVVRDSRSGAGTNRSDISDYYQDIPLHLEIKNQETIKIKEWFRQADQVSNFNLAPAVVFQADNELLVTLRFSDLLQFVAEIADQKAEIDDLRSPTSEIVLSPRTEKRNVKLGEIVDYVAKEATKKIKRGAKTCRNGHISDEYGYCQQLDCKYSRGYRPPKAKRL